MVSYNTFNPLYYDMSVITRSIQFLQQAGVEEYRLQSVNLHTWFPIWQRAFSPGDTVVDIGAFTGTISTCLAFMNARVHAFEGSPINVPKITRTVSSLNQIIIHPVAVSNVAKKCKTRFNDCNGRAHPVQDVEYVIYDEYAEPHGIHNPRFIKMDIEGMETVALLGMTHLLESIRPVWQIEYHNDLPFRYRDYPGFVPKEQGGFDFSTFPRLNYRVINEWMQEINIQDMLYLRNHFMIPEEQWREFKSPTTKIFFL